MKKKPLKKPICKWLRYTFLILVFLLLFLIILYILLPKYGSRPSRANLEATQINTLSAGIKVLYGTNFKNLNNEILIKADLVPQNMIVKNSTTIIKNLFDANIIVESTTLGAENSNPDNAYKITYFGVPIAECQKLSTGVAMNFVQLDINDKIVRQYPSVDSITEEEANKACIKEKNTIVFYGN